MLHISNLSKIFHSPGGIITALDNISLNVDVGEFVAVQGPSGSGKTTLLLTVGGLLEPSSGMVMINGSNLYQMSADKRASFRAAVIGFVFQQFYLIPYLSVLDNVLAPSLALHGQHIKERAEKLIAHFNLTARIYHTPSELSTGERQRAAMARALLNNPTLLLADEPMGNLDNENARIIINYMKEFTASGGSVLLVTHDNRITDYAHRTVHLKDGRLL